MIVRKFGFRVTLMSALFAIRKLKEADPADLFG
jgi:hypothetical protein